MRRSIQLLFLIAPGLLGAVGGVKGREPRLTFDGFDEEEIQQAIQNSYKTVDATHSVPSAQPSAASFASASAVVHHQLYPPEAELGSSRQLRDYTRPRLSHPVDMAGVFDVDSDDSDDDAGSDGGAGVENTPPPAGTEEGDKKPAAKPRPQRPPSHQVTRGPPALSEITSPNVTTKSGRKSIKRMTMSVAEACGESECDSDSDASISDSDSDSDNDFDSTPFRDITNRNLPAASRRQRTTRQSNPTTRQSNPTMRQSSVTQFTSEQPQKKARTTRNTSSSAQASTRAASTTSSAQASTQATSMTRDDYIELARDRFFDVEEEEAPENYPLEMESRRFSGRYQFTCQMCPNPEDRKRSQTHPNSHFLRLCAKHTPRCAMRDRSCRHCRKSGVARRGLCPACLLLLLPAIYEEFRAKVNARIRHRYANDRRFRALCHLRRAAGRIKYRSRVGLSTLEVVGLPRTSLYYTLLRLLCNERNCSLESLQKSFSDNPNDRRHIDHVEPLAQVTTREYWVRNGYAVIPDQQERDRRAGHWTVLDVIPEPENLANSDNIEGRLRWIEAEGRWRAVPGRYSRIEYTLADLEAADNDDDLNELDLDEDELWD
eukprot:scaffold5504_cov53-Cyclotella_meneghiniana.AAC.8